MMQIFNKPLVGMTTLMLFMFIAQYSLEYRNQKANQYNNFINKQLQDYKSKKPKMQAEIIKEIWNISEAELDQPINIFKENEQ